MTAPDETPALSPMNEHGPEIAPSRLGSFVLVRLMASGKPPAPAELRKSLRNLFADRLGLSDSAWAAQVDGTLTELRRDGLLEPKKLIVTPAGQAAVSQFLGVDSLPAKRTWPLLRNRYLLAKTLGVRPQSAKDWEKLGTADGLRAAILTRHFHLPLAPGASLAQVLRVLAWSQLTQAHELSLPTHLEFTRNNVLSATLLSGQSGPPGERLPTLVIGARRNHPDALREAVLRRWLDEQEGRETASARITLPDFARRVKDLARTSPTGRLGENKVFISHIWDRFRTDPAASALTRPEFNRLLLEANREDLLALSQADLVGLLEPADVADSAVSLASATFHLVRIDS